MPMKWTVLTMVARLAANALPHVRFVDSCGPCCGAPLVISKDTAVLNANHGVGSDTRNYARHTPQENGSKTVPPQSLFIPTSTNSFTSALQIRESGHGPSNGAILDRALRWAITKTDLGTDGSRFVYSLEGK